MSQDRRYSGGPVLVSCLLSLACIVVAVLSVSWALKKWFGPVSNEAEQGMVLLIWLIAIALGGYYAARRGKPTGWPNSLAVGLLAELFVAGRLLKGTTIDEMHQSFQGMISDPRAHWRELAALALTIPAAVVPGITADVLQKRRSSRKEATPHAS